MPKTSHIAKVVLLGLFTLFILSCKDTSSRFELMKPSTTGVAFNNELSYTEAFNPYTYRNFYNGAGVALGDINNDGLIDIYFTGNLVNNALYLNRGDFKFEEIAETAGVACKNIWSSGATFVDINQDGWLDLYVCKSGMPGGENRHNELFINQKDNTFKESSAEYGLDITGLSVQAAFFDYDLDGDLDCYLLNNSMRSVGAYDLIENQRNIPDMEGNKLLENRNGHFVNVSEEAGIYSSKIGFGLGITLSDFNNDLWPDLFISNDFFEKDYLYINNQNGGFDEMGDSYFNATSMGSMGADAADIDNDLNTDLMVTEMLPETLSRKKLKASYESWDKHQLAKSKGYGNQFPRNVLQRNMGAETFAEISRIAGVEGSEWSWAALFFDMDNDG
ncbi:MAG: VCBS repeat-containing protein, partial [Flavobacteriaceae bacterium]|nr:VCBS repeat-containing protein [Flavobacteriaceae bacterium]